MGLLAGLGGALQVSIYASAMPDMQQGGEMDVIAACVIGGVSMSGGRGTVLGAFLLGSLILCNYCKGTSADSILRSAVAEYHQGCYHSCSRCCKHCFTAYSCNKKCIKGKGDVIMAGKSGRSINNVPKSPCETDDLQLGRHSGTPCLLQ